MATTVRGSSGGREKKGASPSGSLTKRSPKPSKSTPTSSSSSPVREEKSSSITDSKPVPNYLRPTISSSLDPSRRPKKPSTNSSAQKPVLDRRKSFDLPPSGSQVQKAVRGAPSVREIKPIRSSSFTHKSVTPGPSTRATSEKSYLRSSSGVKDRKAESQLAKSRSLKKSTMSSTPPLSYRKKAPKSVTSESSVDNYDNPSVDQLAAEDDSVNIDQEVQSLPEISEMPGGNKELGDPPITQSEVKHVEDVQDSTVKDDDHKHKSPASDQPAEETTAQESATPDVDMETTEEHILETKPDKDTTEGSADNQPEVKAKEQNLPGDGAGEENEALKVEPAETLAEGKNEEEALKQEGAKVEEETEAKCDKQSGNSPPAASATPATVATPAKAQVATGKKDKQVYNDVIEETSKKLMGGRKNKVLALAGAFETVISLQDTNNN